MLIKNVPYTEEDFEKMLALPENQDRLLELIHGEIVEKLPTEEHGEIVLNLAPKMRAHAMEQGLGRVTTEARHRVADDPHNVRLPDVSFTAGQRDAIEDGPIPQMPDLAVEIKSPQDKPSAMKKKAEYYLQNGTKLVWLIYPAERQVEELTLNEQGEVQSVVFTNEDVLDAKKALPGFAIAVKEVFWGLRPK